LVEEEMSVVILERSAEAADERTRRFDELFRRE
jgi:hypothetical protein